MHKAIKILMYIFAFLVLASIAFIGIGYFTTQPPQIGEAVAIQHIVDIIKKDREPGKRGQHPKSYGVVWAEFTVDPNIPKELQFGVFKNPEDPKKHFPAWIRFSKARGDDDSKGGVMGMAVKLMNVPGEKILEGEKNAETQDFLLANNPVFFLRNIADYLTFFEKPLPLFMASRWHEALILKDMLAIKISSLLEKPYWSATPYQLDSLVVKYAAKPSVNSGYIKAEDTKTPNHLRESLEKQLQTQDVYFDFCIQKQKDPEKMPIEDPTIEWSEKESEFVKVATIRIPRQTFNSEAHIKFGENLSFTPWHSLPEHTPLGGLNRSRKAVYIASTKARHQDNQVMAAEPTPDTFKPSLLDQ